MKFEGETGCLLWTLDSFPQRENNFSIFVDFLHFSYDLHVQMVLDPHEHSQQEQKVKT